MPVNIFPNVLLVDVALPVNSSKLFVPSFPNFLKGFNDFNKSNPFVANLIALIDPAIAKNP